MNEYNFDVNKITDECVNWISDWFKQNGQDCNAICLMSGGKDSVVGTTLITKAIGPERVIGVGMPDVMQHLNGAKEQSDFLNIKFINCPIDWITDSIYRMKYRYSHNFFNWSNQAIQNIPPRVRMTLGFALAQTHNGRLAGFCNLSEKYIGYETFGGDDFCSFEPLANLTATEIIQIGLHLGLMEKWVYQTPDDGLPNSKPDEEKFGFTYEILDQYIRTGIIEDELIKMKIDKMNKNNSFKRNSLSIPSYNPNLNIKTN